MPHPRPTPAAAPGGDGDGSTLIPTTPNAPLWRAWFPAPWRVRCPSAGRGPAYRPSSRDAASKPQTPDHQRPRIPRHPRHGEGVPRRRSCPPGPAGGARPRRPPGGPRPGTSPTCSTGPVTRTSPSIPYGGGSSVVGGVECRGDDAPRRESLDLTGLDRCSRSTRVSRAARIQAGALGPALEDQLRPHGLTLRHFPQSFEFSTLGGWLATRAGGHYATVHTHIDDFVESMRVVTPAGVCESWRLPGSGAGRRPTGCSSARRASSASSPRRGCACRTGRSHERPPLCASPTSRRPGRRPRDLPVRAPPANCRLLDHGRGSARRAARTAAPCWCSASSPRPAAVESLLDRRPLDLARDHGGSGPATAS